MPRAAASGATTSATSTPYFDAFVEFALADPKHGPALRAFVERLARCYIIRKRAYARAALVGNPSDGYDGKTISLIVRNFWAEVVLYEWDSVEIVLADEDRAKFDSVHDLARDVRLHGYYGGIRLIKATDQTLRRLLPAARRDAARSELLDPLPAPTSRGRSAWRGRARSSSPRCAV